MIKRHRRLETAPALKAREQRSPDYYGKPWWPDPVTGESREAAYEAAAEARAKRRPERPACWRSPSGSWTPSRAAHR